MKELTDALKAVRKHALLAERIVDALEIEIERRPGIKPAYYGNTAYTEIIVALDKLKKAKKMVAKLC
jgi:hypothetical protein